MNGVFCFAGRMLGVFAAAGVLLLSGCATPPTAGPAPELAVMKAAYTPVPVKIDGVLDDEAWVGAAVYQMSPSRDKAAGGAKLAEPGEVRFCWDETNFYLAAKFHDSDIVAEGTEDQLHHYKMGDLVELFLKPADATWYWELYVTPANRKTSFWFPGGGRLGLPSGFEYECGLQVAAQNNGTLNDWQDRDSYWTAEMSMPIRDLTAHGDAFGPGSEWRVLIGRYNYSRHLPHREYSMTPALGSTDYHRHEEYGILELGDPRARPGH